MQTQVVTLDVLKPIGTTVDLSDSFNARVGDKMTPFQLFITEGGVAKDLKGMHPELEAEVGNGALRNGVAVMAAGAKGVHWVGSTNNVTGYNQLTLAFPPEVFPQSGFCYGHLILANDAGVRETSVDIWFQVFDGTPLMGLVADHYDSELQLELAKAKNANDQFSQEMRDTYNQQVIDAQNALIRATSDLSHLSESVGAVQARIDADNIITKQQFDDLNKGIVKMATESFAQPKSVASLNELQTAYPTGSKGIFVTTDNNHYYMWQDNSWHDFGTFFNAGITDSSIHLQKLSSNLQDAFTPNVAEVKLKLNDGFLSAKDNQIHSNKEVTTDSKGQYSNDIQVSPGEEYFVHGQSFWSGSLVVFKNSNGVVDFYPKNTLDHTVHTLRVIVPNDADTMVINTDSYTIPRVFKINAYNTFEQVVQSLGFMLDKKKFNFQDFSIHRMSQYGFWSHKDGAFHPLTPNDTNADIAYQPIKVSPLEVYRITGCSAWDARLYTIIDAQGNVISSYPDQEGQFKQLQTTVVMPANAAFLEINEVLPGTTTKVEKATSIIDSSKLPGVKWCAIGDSWTTIHADKGQGYVKNVAEQLGITADNAGGSGTGYMTKYKTEPFYQRKISPDADIYTIFGSFNDAYNKNFKFGNSGDTGTDTLWGAIKATVDNIYSTNFDAQIGIIAPGPWGAINPRLDKNAKMSSLVTFEDSSVGDMSIVDFAENYVQTLHDFAKENSLPFLDLYHYSNLRPWDSNFINKYYHGSFDTDTTHPNAIAFAKFIAPKITNFIKSLV